MLTLLKSFANGPAGKIILVLITGIGATFGYGPEEWMVYFIGNTPLSLLIARVVAAAAVAVAFFYVIILQVQSTTANTISLGFGEEGKHVTTLAPAGHHVSRTLSIEVKNNHGAKPVTGCSINIINIAPPTAYNWPVLLKAGMYVAAGESVFVPFAGHNDTQGAAKSPSSEKFFTIFAEKTLQLPVRLSHLITLKITAFDTRPSEAKCRVWVDESGQLRIAAAEP